MKTNKSKLYVYSTNKTVSNIERYEILVMPTEVAVDDMSRQQIMYHLLMLSINSTMQKYKMILWRVLSIWMH